MEHKNSNNRYFKNITLCLPPNLSKEEERFAIEQAKREDDKIRDFEDTDIGKELINNYRKSHSDNDFHILYLALDVYLVINKIRYSYSYNSNENDKKLCDYYKNLFIKSGVK